MGKNYYNERNKISKNKINCLLKELPSFCSQFFIGIENTTSPLTRLNYAYDLRIFFSFISTENQIKISDMTLDILNDLTAMDIELFISYLSNYSFNNKTFSCNQSAKSRKLSTIKSMYKYFYNRDLITSNSASKISTPKIHEKEIIRLNIDEVADLVTTIEGDLFAGKKQVMHTKNKGRDLAIITLFLGTGIRISELVGLNIDDFDFKDNSFVVTRKGGSRTILYYNEEVKTALTNYIDFARNNYKINPEETAMFISMKGLRISVRTVEELVKKYAKLVTPLKKITPHKLRTTFGTNLYGEIGDIYAVADILGHKDVNTTRKHYSAIGENSRRNAVEKIKLKE